MAGLTGKSIASAYKSILRVDDDSNGIDATVEAITDGEGTKSALKLSNHEGPPVLGAPDKTFHPLPIASVIDPNIFLGAEAT